ncbi:MAG: sugar phosphate isomerase/epimerase [Candidatus Aenigmarchaeota archaeon]|nr:sugar phosphate isomerase/epimerase [Candidatus Aenigmarchaeota archaeon]
MKFGHAIWYGDRPFEKAIKNIHRIGYDYIELSLDYPTMETLEKNKEMVKRIKALLKDLDMEIGFHAPFAGVELLHPRKIISDAGFKIMERAMKFATQFSPAYFDIHLRGNPPTIKLRDVREEIYDKSILVGQRLSKLNKKLKLNITIENKPNLPFCFLDDFKFFFAGVKDLDMCLDVGHVICANNDGRGKNEGNADISEWIDAFKNKIKVLHLHNCRKTEGSVWDHYILEDGIIDIEKVCKQIKDTKCKYIQLEIFSNENGLANDKDFKRNLELVKTFL